MQRSYKFVIGIALITASVGYLVYTAVDQTKMYMVTVGEYLSSAENYSDTTVRIAGTVAPGSVNWNADDLELDFTIRDAVSDAVLPVHYHGLLPDMFAEERDVVVEGPTSGTDVFQADTILTACPSKYEPE